MQIGVLALQGAFIEHEQMLAKLGVSSFEIRCLDDLKKPFDGLIIPAVKAPLSENYFLNSGF